jgi:hypothetical protein
MNKWKDIQGYEDLYRVNANGEIYSVKSDKILKPFYRGSRPDNRYFVVELHKNNKGKTVSIHRLVAEAFIPNPSGLPCVNHKDGNKFNNNVENLEWCSYKQNNVHAYKTGLKKCYYGTENKNSKLSYNDVVEIKKNLILGDSQYGTRPLAEKYGVDHKVIMDIYHNKKYQDVKIPYTYFVSSDIHGAYTIWMNALKDAGFNKNKYSHKVVVCGDLFDRMDEAVQCFEFAKSLGDRFIYVRGNHEDLIFDCYQDLINHCYPGYHHKSNGTLNTLSQFTGLSEAQLLINTPERNQLLRDKIHPLIEWIRSKSVDYFEFGNYICVHGWIPCWNHLDDFRDADDSDWKEARWLNGMEMWRNPRCRVDGKTIICGHWHCSWGWSHIRQERKEFPQKSRKDWLKSFEPFIDDGIIAIDACTAYTGIVNCIVLEG